MSAFTLKTVEITESESIEGVKELWLKVNSGFYASYIVTVIYNHPNNKNYNILKFGERFQDIRLKKKISIYLDI